MNNIQNLLHSPEIQENYISNLHILNSSMRIKRQLGNAYLKLYLVCLVWNWTGKKFRHCMADCFFPGAKYYQCP